MWFASHYETFVEKCNKQKKKKTLNFDSFCVFYLKTTTTQVSNYVNLITKTINILFITKMMLQLHHIISLLHSF